VDAVHELCRHYWASIPARSPERVAKLKRIVRPFLLRPTPSHRRALPQYEADAPSRHAREQVVRLKEREELLQDLREELLGGEIGYAGEASRNGALIVPLISPIVQMVTHIVEHHGRAAAVAPSTKRQRVA